MREEVIILADYLGLEVDQIKENDYNLFEDIEEGEMYYVFEDADFLNYIRDTLIPDQVEEVELELKKCTKHSNFSSFYLVDEDEIEEYCLVNTEEIMDTEERVLVEVGSKNFLILKVK